MPVTATAAVITNFPIGAGILNRGGTIYTVQAVVGGGGIILVEDAAVATTLVSQGVPATLQSGDIIIIQYAYLTA